MVLSSVIRVSFRALYKNKLRAGLTVLGIVIGVGAVITMVSMGQSAQDMVMRQFEALGTNMVIVVPGNHEGGGVRSGNVVTLTPDDAAAMLKECPSVAYASPIVAAREQVIYGNSNWRPNEIYGVDDTYPTIRNWNVKQGEFFTDREINSSAKTCVIGQTIVEKLFQTTNPIGQNIRIKNIPFTVIGVLEIKGANMFGVDQDDILLAPYTTIRKRITGSSFNNVDMILVAASTREHMPDAQREIRALLRDRHRIREGETNDFTVRDTTEIANVLNIITGTMTFLLASIASVSLLVGGVGIMNIMLVSVKERTREIGIRMAVGARGRDIMMQFLIEAVLLSSIGGLIGVIGGITVSWGLTSLVNSITTSTRWQLIIAPWSIIVAMSFSAAVGMFFGFYPAYQASKLDPIDALRYE
jgi:putative ABC transport system permease protein